MAWTEERVEQLSALWGSGKSASEIADIIGGVTRNAVIGKAHRLGLSGRPSPIKRKPSAPPQLVTTETPGATILNLTDRMCRWPIGDPRSPAFRFCGRATVPGETYCREHSRKAYQAPKTKRADEKKRVRA